MYYPISHPVSPADIANLEMIDRSRPIRWEHPQASGLLSYWPTLLSSGTTLKNYGTIGDNLIAKGAAVTLDSNAQFGVVGNSTSNSCWGGNSTGGNGTGYASWNWPGGPITISFWAFARSNTTYYPVMLMGTGSDRASVKMWGTWQNNISFRWSQYGGSISSGNNTAPSLNNWHHIALTADESSTSISVDGKTIKTGGSIGTLGAKDRISLGASVSYSTGIREIFDGMLADWRIYNRVLTQQEIWNLYAPQTRWDMLNIRSTRFYSVSGGTPAPSTIYQRRRPGILRVGSRSVA